MDSSATVLMVMLALLNVVELYVLTRLVRRIEKTVCDTNTPQDQP